FLKIMHFPDLVTRHRATEPRSARTSGGEPRPSLSMCALGLLLSACGAHPADVPAVSAASLPPPPSELEIATLELSNPSAFDRRGDIGQARRRVEATGEEPEAEGVRGR